MKKLIYHQEECYDIIGKCYEVHNHLGTGFLEIVYKEALEFELKNAGIPYQHEVKYKVNYKGNILQHCFYADFVVYDNIILEVKATPEISNRFVAQAINYLKVSDNKLAIIVNFGESQVTSKRIVL